MDLLERGYNVLKPSVLTGYDRAVELDGILVKIEIKIAQRQPSDSNSLLVIFNHDVHTADVVAVVDRETATVYYVPTSEIALNARGITLRTTPRTIDRKARVAFDASDYRDFPFVNFSVQEER